MHIDIPNALKCLCNTFVAIFKIMLNFTSGDEPQFHLDPFLEASLRGSRLRFIGARSRSGQGGSFLLQGAMPHSFTDRTINAWYSFVLNCRGSYIALSEIFHPS